jgi:hypothetical protein
VTEHDRRQLALLATHLEACANALATWTRADVTHWQVLEQVVNCALTIGEVVAEIEAER